jgi:hypothetical protein
MKLEKEALNNLKYRQHEPHYPRYPRSKATKEIEDTIDNLAIQYEDGDDSGQDFSKSSA